MVPLMHNDHTPTIIDFKGTNKTNEVWGQQQQVHRHHHNDNDFCDPYHILHIRRDATKYEMKRSYQQLALLYHPSLTISTLQQQKQQQSNEQKLFLFTLIAASYETLSITETRQRMDIILSQQQKQQNQMLLQQTTATNLGMKKSEKHSATSAKDGKNNEKKSNIVISKEEHKIRKRLQQERRLQQQQRRENNNNNNKKKKNTKNNNSKVESLKKPILLSPSSSTASSYNYHHRHRNHRVIQHDSCSGTDDNTDNCKVPAGTCAIATAKKQCDNDINGIQSRQTRKNIKRGYNWNYASSSCGCPNTDDNDNSIIPYDEPFDRIDQNAFTPTTTNPVVSIVKKTSTTNHNNKSNIPPALVGSSDSELNDDDDDDSDYPLPSFQNITKEFYQQQATIINTDTERWFGGPLKFMYRARKFQPFTNAFVLFERTFRSGIITTTQHQQPTHCCTNTNNEIVGLLPHHKIPKTTLATFSSSNNVVPISTADDTMETLQDGTIITRTHRTSILPANVEKQVMQKTISRTITRYPPDPTNNHRRMTVSVTSDCNTVLYDHNNADAAFVLSSSGSFSKNLCVDFIGWMTCNSSGETTYYETSPTNHEDENMSSWWRSWLPTC